MMSQLATIPNQILRRFRGSFQSCFLQRRLNYSQKPDEAAKVSRRNKYLFLAFFGVAATAFTYYARKEKEYGK